MQAHLLLLSYFIFGDSAYAIESFILPPFDNVKSKSPEDAYNFYHSSARITVECAFGDRHLGIFWSAISHLLYNTCLICEGDMYLHNFLVDFRNEQDDPKADKVTEDQIFDYDRLDNAIISSVVTSNTYRPAGRPSNEEISCRMNGLLLKAINSQS